jgi:hypothetical protein
MAWSPVKTKRKRRADAMPRTRPLVDAKGEVRELTKRDLHAFRPAADALPTALQRHLGVQGLLKAPTKEHITIDCLPT